MTDITIEPNFYRESVGRPSGGYNVYKHDEYPNSSVLAGQERRTFCDFFDTIEEAQAAFPAAYVSGDTHRAPYLPATPPSWFDPANAGEEW